MRRSAFLTCPAFLLALALALLAAPVRADGDHDRARAALQRGEILPLTAILAAAQARVSGRVIGVELERDDGRWIYELELVTPRGRLVEMEIDAATGRILELEDGEDEDERGSPSRRDRERNED